MNENAEIVQTHQEAPVEPTIPPRREENDFMSIQQSEELVPTGEMKEIETIRDELGDVQGVVPSPVVTEDSIHDTSIDTDTEKPKGTVRSWLKERGSAIMDSYFRIREFEPTLYERLGVKLFRDYVPSPTLGLRKHFESMKGDFTGGVDSLEEFRTGTKAIEASHVALSVLFHTVAFSGGPVTALVMEGVNILVNGYPIMLQRYNRSRADRVIARMERVRGNASGEPPARA